MRRARFQPFAIGLLAILAGGLPPTLSRAGEGAAAPPSHLGVIDADGRPAEGALVVEAALLPDGTLLFDPTSPVLATTSESGSITPAPASASGRLVVFRPGSAAVLLPLGPAPALVMLSPAAPITGRLRWAAPLKPPEGLAIEAEPIDGASDLVHRDEINAEGRYAFAHVPPGRYRLRLVRSAGTREDLGVAVAGAPPEERTTAGGASLRAEIRDGDATGSMAARGATVRLDRIDRIERADAAGGKASVSSIVTSDAQGKAVFENMPEGVYEATLLDPDRVWDGAPPRVEVDRPGSFALPIWWLRRRGAIEGRVLDRDEHPVAGASVLISPPPNAPAPQGGFGGRETVKTGPDGAFRFGRLAAAPGWRLVAFAPGLAPKVVSPIEVIRDRTTMLTPVHLEAAWTLLAVVRDAEGRPIKDAAVEATPADRPAPDPADRFSRPFVRAAVTDAEGRAALADLPGSDIVVRAGGAGFLQSVVAVAEPIGRRSIEQAIVLAPSLSILGRVTAAGGPPAGIRVRCVSRATGSVTETEPGPDGKFELKNLAPSPVDVEAVGSSAALVLARADGVLPGSREAVVLDLAPTRRVAGMARGLSLSGAVAHVRLEVRPREAKGEETRTLVAIDLPLPAGDSDVPFAFPAVPSGPAALRLVQGLRDSGSMPILVDGRDLEGSDLALPLGAHLEGRLIQGRGGAPALGARVTLIRWDGSAPAPRAAGPLPSAVADRDGRFLFDDVAAGLWRLEAEDHDAPLLTMDVRLVEGEFRSLGPVSWPVGGTIAGRLLDRRGKGVAGSVLRFLEKRGLREDFRATSGEDGAFRAEPLAAGRYVIRVEDRGASEPSMEAEAEVSDGATTTVELSSAGRAQLGGTVRRRGVVVAGVTLEAVLEDSFGLDRLIRRTTSDAFGKFRWDGLPAGRYSLRTLDGGVESGSVVMLRDGDRVDRDVDLGEGRIVGSVRTAGGQPVRDAEVFAVPAGSATLGADARATTGADGKFALAGLPIGLYRIEIVPLGRPTRAVDGVFADLPGSGRPVDVILGLGARLDLLVHDDGRRGVMAAEVWVEDAAGNALHPRPFYSSPSGRVHIEGLPDGPARVRVSARGLARTRPIPVTLRDGATSTVDVPLHAPGSVRLSVVAGRDPAARARVDLLRMPERERAEVRRPLRYGEAWSGNGLTTRVGTLFFDDLEEGEYLLVVAAGGDYAEARVPVRVKRGETTEARVVLQFRPR